MSELTARDLSFHPASDPFGMTAPLTHDAMFPVLGVPLHVRSNAVEAIRLAERSFGSWRALDPGLVERDRPARLDIVVHGGGTGEPLPSTLVLRRHGPVYVATAGSNVFATVVAERHAVCFVTPAALADERWYLHHVNANGRFVASLTDRTPIHAAVVLARNTAVVLAGASGAGKSTLCYACARAGLRVLSEEVVHVSLRRGLRLWGEAAAIGLSADAPRLFPELAGVAPTVRPDGTPKIVVPLPGTAQAPLTHAGRVVLCLVERAPGPASESGPMEGEEARERMTRRLDQGFDMFAGELPRVVDALLSGPVLRFRAGRDLDAAVALIEGL